ncbi:hypothetical protein HK405_009515, partial [Cladochytrium tenue]
MGVVVEAATPSSPPPPQQHQQLAARWREFLRLRDLPGPTATPHVHKYAARGILDEMRAAIAASPAAGGSDDDDGDIEGRRAAVLSFLDFQQGLNLVATEELTAGERLLTAAAAGLRARAAGDGDSDGDDATAGRRPWAVAALVDALNQLAVVWFDWNEHRRAAALLEEAADAYRAYTGVDQLATEEAEGGDEGGQRRKQPPPLADPVLAWCGLEQDDDGWAYLEGLHTYTTYYLAQVYGALKLKDKSAEFCKLTLQRQLRHGKLNGLTWALDCMTLAQYYFQNNAFVLAHECLSSAEHVLLSTAVPEDVASGEVRDEGGEDAFLRAKADLECIWGKFYLAALQISVNDDPPPRLFAGLPLLRAGSGAPAQRPGVPARFATTSGEARTLFLACVAALTEALGFFRLDGHVTDHVAMVRDQAQAYAMLARFESDPGRRAALLRRRCAGLSALLGVPPDAGAAEVSAAPSFGGGGGGRGGTDGSGRAASAAAAASASAISRQHFPELVRALAYDLAVATEALGEAVGEAASAKAVKGSPVGVSKEARDCTVRAVALFE